MAKRGRKRRDGVIRYPNGEIKSEIVLTPERCRHGSIELLDQAIADDAGRPSRPYRVIDAWAQVDGITPEMYSAGADFRAKFATAGLVALRAADVARPVVHGRLPGDIGSRAAGAREAVWRALLAVGGIGSAGGSCLWHIVGWEQPLDGWARHRRLTLAEAATVLVDTLGALDAHYNGGSTRIRAPLSLVANAAD